MTPDYESADVPGMYFVGSAAHSLDYRQASGGFIHGFRYTGMWPGLAQSSPFSVTRNEIRRVRVRDHPSISVTLTQGLLVTLNIRNYNLFFVFVFRNVATFRKLTQSDPLENRIAIALYCYECTM